MVKKVTVKKDLPQSFRGIFSTFMISIIMLFVVFLLPMISANQAEKGRSGEGRFTPVEEIIWDFDGKSDFENVKYTSTKDDIGENHRSSTSVSNDAKDVNEFAYWKYHTLSGPDEVNVIDGISDSISIIDIANPNVVDNYGIYTFLATAINGGNPFPHTTTNAPNHNSEEFRLYFDIDVDKMVDGDAVSIDLYANLSESLTINPPTFRVEYRTNIGEFELQGFEVLNNGGISTIDIDTSDLIQIAALKGSKEYLFVEIRIGSSQDDDFADGTPITFDLQVNGLKTRTPSITIIAVWNVIMSIVIVFLAIISHPSLSIGDIVDSLVRMTR